MNNNKQQTAVEWLKKELETYGSSFQLQLSWELFDEIINQAKEMFEQQIIEAYQKGVVDGYGDSLDFSNCSDAENYIKETYGGDK